MEWIKVTDRLPESPDRVIVFYLDLALLCYAVAWFDGKKFYFDVSLMNMTDAENHSAKPLKITHWMPLPNPPQE